MAVLPRGREALRILVYPEQLRRTAQTFRWAAGLWNEQAAYLERALNSLHWEVRQRTEMEGQMTQAIRLARGLAEGAHSQAVFLEQAATRFEVADRQGVQGVEAIVKNTPFRDPSPWFFLTHDPVLFLGILFGLGIPIFGWPLIFIGQILRNILGFPGAVLLDAHVQRWLHPSVPGQKAGDKVAVKSKSTPQPRAGDSRPGRSRGKVIQRLEVIKLQENAPTHDCVAFVRAQRQALGKKVPDGFNHNKANRYGKSVYPGFYTGAYKGKSGTLPDGTQYGQEPKVGAIMVESPNPKVNITYGHASFVYEVTRDATGKVIRFKVAEANWTKTPPIHHEEFFWDEKRQAYVSSNGKRVPDMFIY